MSLPVPVSLFASVVAGAVGFAIGLEVGERKPLTVTCDAVVGERVIYSSTDPDGNVTCTYARAYGSALKQRKQR